MVEVLGLEVGEQPWDQGARANVVVALPGGTAMKVTGGCHSRHVTYKADVDPTAVGVCHCTDCQTRTGTVSCATIASLSGTLATNETAKTHIKIAESGNKRVHAFCPKYGEPSYAAAAESSPSTYRLRVDREVGSAMTVAMS